MIGMVVPFAFAIAALGQAARFDLAASSAAGCSFRGLSWRRIITGGKWAYVGLGWGAIGGGTRGKLIAHALAQARPFCTRSWCKSKGMLKVWNMILAILCYGLCIWAFITRSGIISSVHAFAKSNIGPFFAVFLVPLLSLLLVYSSGLPQLKPENGSSPLPRAKRLSY